MVPLSTSPYPSGGRSVWVPGRSGFSKTFRRGRPDGRPHFTPRREKGRKRGRRVGSPLTSHLRASNRLRDFPPLVLWGPVHDRGSIRLRVRPVPTGAPPLNDRWTGTRLRTSVVLRIDFVIKKGRRPRRRVPRTSHMCRELLYASEPWGRGFWEGSPTRCYCTDVQSPRCLRAV